MKITMLRIPGPRLDDKKFKAASASLVEKVLKEMTPRQKEEMIERSWQRKEAEKE